MKEKRAASLMGGCAAATSDRVASITSIVAVACELPKSSKRARVCGTAVMLHALLTALAYTPHTALNTPPRRPVRAWASCTAAGAELSDQPAAPVDESVSSHLPPLPILLRTDNYIFVAKPANTVVHRNRFLKKGDVPLMQRLRDQLGVRVNPVLTTSSPRPRPRPRPRPHRK